MSVPSIEDVITIWQKEFDELGAIRDINYVQIFENKGAVMGCSNPHPHGQIWSQNSIPQEVIKKGKQQLRNWQTNTKSLLGDYLKQEIKANERIIWQDEYFIAIVPYWAIWPYEVIVAPKRHLLRITDLTDKEKTSFAKAIKVITTKYDNLFETSFPYSSGIH